MGRDKNSGQEKKTKKDLKAIFFDIDDTIYSTSEFAKMARLNSVYAMIEAGLQMSVTECFDELKEVIEEFGTNFGNHYDRLLLRLPKEKYENINPAVIVAAGVVAYHETKYIHLKPYEDVVEVFRLLSNTDLVLGIITAGLMCKQAEKLVRLKILKYLTPHAIFITDQIGIGKPNVKLYKKAYMSLKFRPEECMYVGDNPIADIDPPSTLGMITALNRRSGKYIDVQGKADPDYVIHDMWELLTILKRDFGVKVE
ncbi:MAG: HAD-IA family hydrolase [bacterium]